jgi:hypothetical protein
MGVFVTVPGNCVEVLSVSVARGTWQYANQGLRKVVFFNLVGKGGVNFSSAGQARLQQEHFHAIVILLSLVKTVYETVARP